MPAADYSRRQRGDGRGRVLGRTYGQDLMKGENPKFAQGQPQINSLYNRSDDAGHVESQSGTSIFDPCLTECVYQWFAPGGSHVLDPFCGGSVRGLVASLTGRKYIGIDLSEGQILANREQAREICPKNPPTWIHGDSANVKTLVDGRFDLLFSCPPYFDLEQYSNDPGDLSNMAWAQFLKSYQHIISESCAMLRDNRFAVFVVGDIRDRKTGFYRNLPGQTITAFQDAGLNLYNHGILLNALGSLPIRSHKQMQSGRKLGKCHQDVLCFIKGNWREALASLSNEKIRGTYV
ncbi:MAG: class I SAM-dependent methyltransferase [Nitrospina sp.]|nr:class I SAM-dependent methyltransferase [Nitrospina sp.]